MPINKLPGLYLYSDVFFYVPIIGNETDELTYELFSVMLALLYYNWQLKYRMHKQTASRHLESGSANSRCS